MRFLKHDNFIVNLDDVINITMPHDNLEIILTAKTNDGRTKDYRMSYSDDDIRQLAFDALAVATEAFKIKYTGIFPVINESIYKMSNNSRESKNALLKIEKELTAIRKEIKAIRLKKDKE